MKVDGWRDKGSLLLALLNSIVADIPEKLVQNNYNYYYYDYRRNQLLLLLLLIGETKFSKNREMIHPRNYHLSSSSSLWSIIVRDLSSAEFFYPDI